MPDLSGGVQQPRLSPLWTQLLQNLYYQVMGCTVPLQMSCLQRAVPHKTGSTVNTFISGMAEEFTASVQQKEHVLSQEKFPAKSALGPS